MQVQLAKEAARLFEYPDAGYLARLSDLEHRCQAFAPPAAAGLSDLLSRLSTVSVDELRELYTRTFDLTPACAPYLSVHLFGEGSFKRARLMTGLAESYASKSITSGTELPDHLGVVLGALEQLDPIEQHELLTYCVRSALEKMYAELKRLDNPYLLAILAVQRLVATWIENAEVTCA